MSKRAGNGELLQPAYSISDFNQVNTVALYKMSVKGYSVTALTFKVALVEGGLDFGVKFSLSLRKAKCD